MTDLVKGLVTSARTETADAQANVVLVEKAKAEKRRIVKEKKVLGQEIVALRESIPPAEDRAAKAVAYWRELEARRATLVVPGYPPTRETRGASQHLAAVIRKEADPACRQTKDDVARMHTRIAQLEATRVELDSKLQTLGQVQLEKTDEKTLATLKTALGK